MMAAHLPRPRPRYFRCSAAACRPPRGWRAAAGAACREPAGWGEEGFAGLLCCCKPCSTHEQLPGKEPQGVPAPSTLSSSKQVDCYAGRRAGHLRGWLLLVSVPAVVLLCRLGLLAARSRRACARATNRKTCTCGCAAVATPMQLPPSSAAAAPHSSDCKATPVPAPTLHPGPLPPTPTAAPRPLNSYFWCSAGCCSQSGSGRRASSGFSSAVPTHQPSLNTICMRVGGRAGRRPGTDFKVQGSASGPERRVPASAERGECGRRHTQQRGEA